MARFATISEIESTEIVICRLKSIITEYYFREILKREKLYKLYEERFEERNFTSYTERERDLKRDFISYTKRAFISYTKRETLQVIPREPL